MLGLAALTAGGIELLLVEEAEGDEGVSVLAVVDASLGRRLGLRGATKEQVVHGVVVHEVGLPEVLAREALVRQPVRAAEALHLQVQPRRHLCAKGEKYVDRVTTTER